MSNNKYAHSLILIISALTIIFSSSCSNQKNTTLSRAYHSINTRYNIYFNAEESYKSALKAKIEGMDDNLSYMVYIYPYDPEAADRLLSTSSDTTSSTTRENRNTQQPKNNNSILGNTGSSEFNPLNSLLGGGASTNSGSGSSYADYSTGGSFTITVDKTTKAIKIHSIKTKPRRDRNKAKDEKYLAWIKQQEFNPFMKNVWLLLGKAEMQNGNYIQAIATFMYTTKIYSTNPEIIAECQIGIARSYTEMGWLYEAANIFHKIELNGGVPEKLKGEYSATYANYLMRNNESDKAIAYIPQAIKSEKNKQQKLRMRYSLGQLYEKAGDEANAYKAYGSVIGLNTPYKYTINARLNQLALDESKPKSKVISDLTKMTKGKKNEEYLDKVYYTIGNVYLQQSDSIKAIENYKLAIEKSHSNGYDKALAQVTLGGIYFEQREFVLAQPCYSGALGILKKTDKNYDLVSLRSNVLDELVVHVKTVHEQDSLQHLAQLPEAERMTIILNKIEEIKKLEKEQKKEEEEYQQKLEERNNNISSWDDLENEPLFNNPNPKVQMPVAGLGQGDNTTFYFYNTQTVAQGKVAFQKQWGTRKLEDNWRRRSKSAPNQESYIEDEKLLTEQGKASTDSIQQTKIPLAENDTTSSTDSSAGDIYSPEYYLQQLPFSTEAKAESDTLIENALFKMGGIYKDKLGDFTLAIDAFDTDLRRFPQTPNAQEIYYQLFLMYMQQGNRDMMTLYRNKIISEFATSKYATVLSDSNYEWNLKHMHALQDSLYDATYDAYLDSNTKTVRDNYEALQTKYPFTNLMPKFMLLNALTYAQTKDVAGLKNNLENLTKEYPNSDVAPFANDILERIKEGKVILSDGTPIRGMSWNMAYANDSITEEELQFADNPDSEYILLLFYKTKTIDRNELLYQVADYNFSNYMVQTFDLSFEEDAPLEMLQIRGFAKYSNIRSYLNRAFREEGLAHRIDPSIVMIPISVENSKVLLRLGLDNYISFFQKTYGESLPQLAAHWQGNKPILNISDEDEEVVLYPGQTIEEVEAKTTDTQVTIHLPEKEETVKSPKDTETTTTINASDVLSKEQIGVVNTANDVVDGAEEILSNPVDGIKGLFKKYKNREKLTKEEKAELKEEQRLERQKQKELKAIEKAKQDSISKVEKAVQDSIKNVERLRIEEQKRIKAEKDRIEQEKKDAIKAKGRAKEEARRQKEQDRKNKQREQEERRSTQEKERNDKRKAQEREREEKKKEQDRKRKEQDKIANEKRKQQSTRK